LKFEVIKEDSLWKFAGEGWGHGVGLSQIAAQKMATLGKNYKEILQHHYPLAQLSEIKNGDIHG
jgi:stage II sporulation protein D